jgi:hypothetical protein
MNAVYGVVKVRGGLPRGWLNGLTDSRHPRNQRRSEEHDDSAWADLYSREREEEIATDTK